MEEKKKNIFQKAVDAVSNRDEKEALEKANAELEQVKKQQAAAAEMAKQAANTERIRKELAAKEAAKEAAEKAEIAANQAKQKANLDRVQKEFAEKQAARAAELEAKKAAEAAVVKHVWTNEDTYASLAFKHYGSIQEPYWRLIYNHNKDIIGEHPNNIRTGLEIEIPPLPEELKKK
ncbi:MAG: hypothetical protein CVU39_23920 [Chloroflexi bacterium HGW-Chloroflexi-10]|nr:MAG: hypothetical protein CVU39_23920 [Chloroflexi bacterium HGW-Chloroflexi-10]